jgi:hypothetical protein
MPIRYQLSDIEVILSKLGETGINVPYELTADFVGLRLNSMMPPIPEVAKSSGSMIGDGQERAQNLRAGWNIPGQVTIGGQLNTETAGRFGARNLSGSRTATEVVALSGAYDVVTNQQTKAQGRIPKLSTLGFLLGGYDFLWSSMAVNNFEITFEGDSDVNFSAQLINTGHWQRMGDIIPAIVPPAAPTHHLMHPAATRVTFSDGTTIDYANEGDLISGACGNGNNIVVRALPGDPFIDPDDRQSGAYARDIHRGRRDPFARLKVAMDASLYEFTLARSGQDITSLTYLFVSDDKIGVTAYDYEFEWKFPLCEIQAVSSDTDGDDAALNIEFYVKKDAVSGGFAIQRVRTDDNLLQ